MPIEKITSRKSSVVKNAAALLQKAENRSEAGLFMAEGARLCTDAARSQTEIAACFFTENAAKKYKDYLDPVLKQTEHAYCIEEHIAPMLSDTKNPQGIFCVCRMPKRRADGLPVSAEPDARPCRHVLVMENIQDPSNMGNVLRTAEALGVRHLALVGTCCDVYAPKVLRGSMGAVFRTQPVKADWAEVKAACGVAGIPVAVTALSRRAKDLRNADLRGMAVVIGSEGQGVRREILESADGELIIPMNKRCESLNAAVAAAIVLWQMKQ